MTIPIRRLIVILALLSGPVAGALPTLAADQGKRFAAPFIGAVEATLTGSQGMDLALDAIRGVPDQALPAFGEWFEANAHRMPTIYLFNYANRVFPGNRPLGAQWFFAGRTRLLYDAFRCRDETVVERVAEVDAVLDKIVTYVQQNPAEGAAAGKRALEWDSTNDIVENPKALLRFCLTGVNGKRLAIEQGKPTNPTEAEGDAPPALLVPLPDVGDQSQWVVPVSEYPEARGEAFAVTQKVIDQLEAAAR